MRDPMHTECRLLGHAWKVVETAGYTALKVRCLRCLCERAERCDPWTGKREGHLKYQHAEGYLRTKGDTSPVLSRDDYRLELLKRYEAAAAESSLARG